ncbi:MAG: Holliday junction resolvase RuvX [Clostridiaceae bacterium]|jgi:putative Holliday junction resolvase|nr:Holliday junction resolvase RuvX [Clostridiaceae bacterium]
MRALGIDFGLRRVGIALSDPLRIVASRHSTLNWNGKDVDALIERIFNLCEENQVNTIVVGYPLRTDGDKSPMTDMTVSFADRLRESGREVVLVDERYTSLLAGQILQETKRHQGRDKGLLDRIAAEIILQDYLESERDCAL